MIITPEVAAKIVGILAIIGAVLPHLQALLQKRKWKPRTKAILTWVWSIPAGIIAHVSVFGIPTDLSDVGVMAAWIAGAWSSAALAYGRFWKSVGSTDAAENKLVKDDGPEADELPPEYQHDGSGVAVG